MLVSTAARFAESLPQQLPQRGDLAAMRAAHVCPEIWSPYGAAGACPPEIPPISPAGTEGTSPQNMPRRNQKKDRPSPWTWQPWQTNLEASASSLSLSSLKIADIQQLGPSASPGDCSMQSWHIAFQHVLLPREVLLAPILWLGTSLGLFEVIKPPAHLQHLVIKLLKASID